jgi:DNA-binding NarL/FixJ family response regulator
MRESYRIVLVDDNIWLRLELIKYLETKNDLEIIGEANDGVELLALLDTLSADKKQLPHLVILDISMPRLGGIETAWQIKKTYPSVKILFLSSYDKMEYLDYTIGGGADGFLLKDEMDGELFSAIRMMRQGESYVSPGFIKGITDTSL